MPIRMAIAIATTAGYSWPLPGSANSATATPQTPLTYAIERSISPISSTKVMPYASSVVPAICTMMLLKLTGDQKLLAVWLKTSTMIPSAMMTGQLPRLPLRMLLMIRACSPWGSSAVGGGAGAGVSTSMLVTPAPCLGRVRPCRERSRRRPL